MTDGPLRRLLGVVRRVADPDGGPTSDRQLLERFAAARDEAAFELLVWRHGAMVLGVCRRVLGDVHAAEDAFQATFLALARQARSVRRGESLPGWLHRVAQRVATRARAATARRGWLERRAAVAVAVVPAGEPADDLRAVIDEELERLPARFRLPVVLCYLEGQSTAEAARRLGCPRGTVLSRLATARQRLKARLARRGLGLPAGGLAVLAGAADAPAALVRPTVRAALAFAAGRAALAGVAAPRVIELTEGVLRAMIVSKLKLTAAVVLTVGLLGTGTGWVAWPTAGTGPAVAWAVEPQQPPRAKSVDEPQPPPAKSDDDALAKANARIRQAAAAAREANLKATAEILKAAEIELADFDARTAHDRLQDRFALAEAEERLRQLQRKHDFQREMELARIKVAEDAAFRFRGRFEAEREQKGNDHAEVVALARMIQRARDDQEKMIATHDKKEQERLAELITLRRQVLAAEHDLLRKDGIAAAQRQRLQAQHAHAIADMIQASKRPPEDESPAARLDALERKLDELRRELTELRRELRK